MDDGSEFESWQALTGLLQVSDAGAKLQNWTSSKPISEWESVKSSDTGKVVELNMQNKNVRGRIPTSFGRLSYLRVLRLDGNAFTGEIPIEVLGLLPQLTTFNISGGANNLKLPSNIELLGSSIMSSSRNLMATSTRPPVTSLDLAEQGSIGGKIPNPGIGRLASLEAMILRKNQMTGPIPQSVGDLMNLRILDLSFNNFSGSVPSSLRNCKNLEIINLFHNKFDIPELVTTNINGVNTSSLFVAPQVLLDLPRLRAVDLCDNNYELFEKSSGMTNVTDNVAFIAEICARRGVQLRLPDSVVAELDRMVTNQNSRQQPLAIETKIDEAPLHSPVSTPRSPRSARARKHDFSAFTANHTDKTVTDRSKFYWLHHNHQLEEEVAGPDRSGAGSLIVHHGIDISELADDVEANGQVQLRCRLWEGYYMNTTPANGSMSVRYSDAYGDITHAGVVDNSARGYKSSQDDPETKNDDFLFYNTNSKRNVSPGIWGIIVDGFYSIMLLLHVFVTIIVLVFFASQQKPELSSTYGVLTKTILGINDVLRIEVIWGIVLLLAGLVYICYLFFYEFLTRSRYNYTAFIMHAVVSWTVICSGQVLNLCIMYGYLYPIRGDTTDILIPVTESIADIVPSSFNGKTLMYGCYMYMSISSAYAIWFLHDLLRNRIKQYAYKGLLSSMKDDDEDKMADDRSTVSHMSMDRLDKLFCPLLCFLNCRFPSFFVFVCRVFEVWTISGCLCVGVLLLGIPSVVLIAVRLLFIVAIAYLLPACCQPSKISIDDTLYICCERNNEFDFESEDAKSSMVSTSGQSLLSELRNINQTLQRGFLFTVSPYWVEDVQSGLFAMSGKGSICMLLSTARKLNKPGMLRYKVSMLSAIAVSAWAALIFILAYMFYDFTGAIEDWIDFGWRAEFLYFVALGTFLVYSAGILAYSCFAFKCMKFACYFSG